MSMSLSVKTETLEMLRAVLSPNAELQNFLNAHQDVSGNAKVVITYPQKTWYAAQESLTYEMAE